MSFKTIATLDGNRTDVRRDLQDRDRLHKRLMSLYPDGLGSNPRQAINLLYAVEPDTTNIVIQSDLRPVTGPLTSSRNGYFTAVRTEPLENSTDFVTGDTVQFCFWFCALSRDSVTHKRVDISSETGIYAKAKEQLSLAGLDVSEIDVATKEKIKSQKRNINYSNILLVGIGSITDAQKLKDSIIRGIGAGRLWGSGVLLVSDIK